MTRGIPEKMSASTVDLISLKEERQKLNEMEEKDQCVELSNFITGKKT